jgi:hypothetical protein
MNKKGQEMSVATLVLIVIGIVVLVMLILGFSMGWKNLWGKINVFSGGSNVETVIQACEIAATSDSSYNFCQEFKTITIDGKKIYVNCQDSRVSSTLEKRLSCPEGADDPALKKCQTLAAEAVKLNREADCTGIRVNNRPAPKWVAGTPAAAAGGAATPATCTC